ncbi:MAG: 1,4-dihydroxy-2-naphthoate octaprenyltransferase [Opitutia bacterium UBA7350]|nr:MAG: 1,4-dihydroxy-2-naphthoate octaprenyltransferase [Opitutae bacterium UBA7350]
MEGMTGILRIWLEALRPATLPAGVAPVLLGTALASADGYWLPRAAFICLGFALIAQVGSNFANDYLDGVRGTDGSNRTGPRRAVGAGLIAPQVMRRVAICTLVLAFIVGLSLIPLGGWRLLGVGFLCVLAAWCYTGGPYPLAYNGLGDLCVVFFFGIVAVGCTYYVQTGVWSVEALCLGLGSGFLTNNLLVVNNYRDREQDQAAEKRTLLVRYGLPFGVALTYFSASLAATVVVGLWMRGYGATVLFGLFPCAWSFILSRRLSRIRGSAEFGAALSNAGRVVALYSILLAFGLML